MTSLNVPIPEEMEPYRDDLEYFFVTMVRKLHVNRHKGTSKDTSLGRLMQGLDAERAEVNKALHNEGQFDVPLELADVANFAFLASRTIWHMTRQEYDETRMAMKTPRSSSVACGTCGEVIINHDQCGCNRGGNSCD